MKPCSKLTFAMSANGILGGFGYVTENHLQPQYGNLIDLTATVGNPGDVNNCARSGIVQFSWQNLSTRPNPPPALVATGAVYCISPGLALGSTLVPAGEMGSATGTWDPTSPLVSAIQTTWGKLSAAVSTPGNDACSGDICNPVAADPSLAYTAWTNAFAVLPQGAGMAVRAERSPGPSAPNNVMYFGFGASGFAGETRIAVYAQKHFDGRGFATPDVSVALGKPIGLQSPDLYFSGPVVPGVHVELDGKFAPHVDGKGIERNQGVVRLTWPEGCDEKLGIVEVAEVVLGGGGQGRRLGGFVLGLRNTLALERQIWM